MTRSEYNAWQRRSVPAYAAEHLTAGNWTATEGIQRAEAETRALLSQGLSTERMAFLRALDEQSQPVGRVWICLDHPRRTANCARIYDIDIDEDRRSQGYGRSLLAATERPSATTGSEPR